MLLRIRSPDGTHRVEVQPTDSGDSLATKILELIPHAESVDQSSVKLANRPGSSAESVGLDALAGRKVGDMGFSHGDLLFLSYKASEPSVEAAAVADPVQKAIPAQANTLNGSVPITLPDSIAIPIAGPSTAATGSSSTLSKVKEEPVDDYWRSQDGKIQRKRDEKMCRHGAKGMCDYCMPLEPYDVGYQAERQIKHLSFHAYLRKLQAGQSASSPALPPLTPLDYKVTVPCTSGTHAPWPAGICSKCQPSAITLQSQPFRSVDHVEFASPSLIDDFLTAWRRSAKQRFGLLLGRFDKYEIVPMGIKAVVEAIHEVEQEGEIDGLTLGENVKEEEKALVQRAAWLAKGLRVVGMVYTDLTPNADDRSKVLHKRHAQSYYLSSLEAIFSASQQRDHPNPSRSSPTGTYSSRFVTCVLTGTEDGGVDVMAFQVTEQAVAMVEADMIEASVDPGIVRVKREEGARYIPDVFHSYKNEYGLQVKESAKPSFPVEYLLVNVTHGFPTSPSPLFRSHAFPIENRPELPEQSVQKVCDGLRSIFPNGPPESLDEITEDQARKLAEYLNDWHLYSFLAGCGLFDDKDMKTLAKAVVCDEASLQPISDLVSCDSWKTLMAVMKETPAPKTAAAAPAMDNDGFEEIPAHLLDEIHGITRPSSTGRGTSGGSGLGSSIDDMQDIQGDDFPELGAAGGSGSGDAMGGGGGDTDGPVACPHCTFENPPGTSDCEVCGLPING